MKGAQDVHQLVASYANYEWCPLNPEVLSMGYVIHQWQSNNKLYGKVSTNICATLGICSNSVNCSSLRLQVKGVIDKFNQLKRNITRNWTKIEDYLSSEFHVPLPRTTQTVTPPASIINVALPHKSPSPKKLRKDCDICPVQRSCNINLAEQLKQVKSEKRRTVADIKRDYKVRVINQRLKRHAKRRGDLVSDLTSLQRTCSVTFLKLKSSKQQVKSLMSKVSALQDKTNSLATQNASKTEEINSLRKELRLLEKTISHLTCLLEEKQSSDSSPTPTVISKHAKAYIPPVRLCVYQSLLCQVPVSHTGPLIQFVVQTLGGQTLTHVPSPTTVAQMAYELGVLCLVQLGDFLLHHKNLCLSWDATSLDGAHVNEIHVTANRTQCLTIDLQTLPGGTALDYTAHVVTALGDIASTYSTYHNTLEAEVSAKIHQSLTATVTDRAAVNHATVVQLQEALGSQLLELNCNVHPLDSMASSSRTALGTFDKENGVNGKCLGRNSAATNCILAVSKLRYKQGTGDPGGFKTHFRELGVPIGTFVRYVGNRMHILFHLGGVITAQRNNLLRFVDTHKTGLKGDLRQDLENPFITVQLTALGLVGKVITGPWMTKFYSNESNLNMVPRIQEGKELLDRWCDNPAQLVHPKENIFGEPLDASHDPVLSALVCSGAEDDILTEVLSRLLKAVRCVYTRQLSRYLNPADLADPSEEQLIAASSAPSHNMASERALGMADAQWKRAPNATTGFLNGKLKSNLNKTLEWLQEREDVEKLVSFAVSEGYRARKQDKRRKDALDRELKRRQDASRQQRDSANRKKIAAAVRTALTTEDFNTSLATFGFPQETVAIAQQIATTPSSIIGSLLEHIWFDEKKGDETWYGRASEVKKKRKTTVVIAYWSKTDFEANGEDYSIPLEELLTDFLLGDLSLVN